MLLLVAALGSLSFSQDTSSQDISLGDLARATRAQQSKSPKPAKVFSNEDSSPSEIKDGEDPLQVFQQAGNGLRHSTFYRCQEESSGNSGPGWHKSQSYEVAAPDRMRMVSQDGSDRVEWLLVGDSYYQKPNGGSWKKLTSPQEVALAKMVFPGAMVPQELQFQLGELKSFGDQVVAGVAPFSIVSQPTSSTWIGRSTSGSESRTAFPAASTCGPRADPGAQPLSFGRSQRPARMG